MLRYLEVPLLVLAALVLTSPIIAAQYAGRVMDFVAYGG